jgi:deazaflavin-dependent oxidoreductase (nitroreductase family)
MPWWIDRTSRLRRYVGRLEVWELERFGRSGLGLTFRQQVAVLTTTGRRSGVARRTPVAYMPYGDGYLIGGGAGGQKATPDWVHNLRATPRASLLIDKVEVPCDVTEPTGEERAHAFDAMAARWPGVRRYEKWGQRPLPLFVFRPN